MTTLAYKPKTKPCKSGKHCCVCGLVIPHRRFEASFGRTEVCDHTCKKALAAGRTRGEQFRWELENPEHPDSQEYWRMQD